MKEEEVDQYFNNKFNQFAPAPSTDAWARLQSQIQPAKPKRPTMWLYYAAAAITLVLLSGVLLFWQRANQPDPNTNVAKLKPVITPFKTEIAEQPILAKVTPATVEELPETTFDRWSTEAVSKGKVTPVPSSKPVKKKIKVRPGILIARNMDPIPYQGTGSHKPVKAVKPENTLPVNSENLIIASNETNQAQVTEVVIIKDEPSETVAYAGNQEYATAEQAIKEDLNRKGKLVKNILKQARNLKNGEKVELSTLGLSANYRIDVESKLLKHKYSKVINL